MWAIGVAFVEMCEQGPPFPGSDAAHQIQLIFEKRVFPEAFTQQLPEEVSGWMKRLREREPAGGGIDGDISKVAPSLAASQDEEARHRLDLLDQLLQVDPSDRITTERALEHPFFASIREEEGDSGGGGASSRSDGLAQRAKVTLDRFQDTGSEAVSISTYKQLYCHELACHNPELLHQNSDQLRQRCHQWADQ